jgi:hypothetical protein
MSKQHIHPPGLPRGDFQAHIPGGKSIILHREQQLAIHRKGELISLAFGAQVASLGCICTEPSRLKLPSSTLTMP